MSAWNSAHLFIFTLFGKCSETTLLIQAAFSILTMSFSLFIATTVFLQLVSSYPPKRLGIRPRGHGLWSYMFSQLFGDQQGIWGYDSSLGAVSPIFRLLFHFMAILMLWGVSLLITAWQAYRLPISSARDMWSHLNLLLGITIAFLYISTVGLYWTFFPGVSHPGGPRSNENKIRRMPHWDNAFSTLGQEYNKWVCSVAEESHNITRLRFDQISTNKEVSSNDRYDLSGEPFGRQMWSTFRKDLDQKQILSSEVQAEIAIMASGGRPCRPCENDNGHKSHSIGAFNPSINPNSADIPFRTQMIHNYVTRGGTLPDVKEKPMNPRDAARKGVQFFSMLQTDDGHWAGDYGGPHFLMPGLIIAWYDRSYSFFIQLLYFTSNTTLCPLVLFVGMSWGNPI